MAAGDGGPIYCFISALSTNAKSIAPVTLDVVSIKTLGCLQKQNISYFNLTLKVVKRS